MQLKQFTSCHSASGLQKLQARQRSLQAGQPFLHSSGHWPLADKSMPFESKTQHHRFVEILLDSVLKGFANLFVSFFRSYFQNFSSSSSVKGYERRNCGKVCTWKLWYFHAQVRASFLEKIQRESLQNDLLHVELCQNMNKNWSNRLVP